MQEKELQREIELLRKALERERLAREKAEDLLDTRSSALYNINQKLTSQFKAVAKKTSELEFLQMMGGIIKEGLPMEVALKHFLKLTCELCQWPIGHIYFPEKKYPHTIRSSEIWYLKDDHTYDGFKTTTAQMIFNPGEGLPGLVFSNRRIIWIKDIKTEGTIKPERVINTDLKSALGIPIIVQSKIVAIAEFFSEKINEKDEDLIDIIATGVTQMGSLLEKQTAERKLKENYQKLQQAQLQLIQSEKMASLGTIAAGVAHEINNPISFVLSNIESLGKYFLSLKHYISAADNVLQIDTSQDVLKLKDIREEEDLDYIISDSESLVKETLEGIFRVKEIVQGLKTFSHIDEAEVKEANINECLEATLKVIGNELKYKCELIKDYQEIPPIVCYPGQLMQVFTNLLLNASQAIEGHGQISISTTHQDKSIIINISDTGKGIPENNLKDIFTPFFTTKPVGEGTGLGLSISYGIIKKHHGEIKVHSEPNKGTTFSIQLPIKKAA